MTGEEHIKLLLEGKTTWNKKRELHNFHPNFQNVNFPESFRNANKLDHNKRIPLNRFNLSNAVFFRSDLSQVDFIEADLRAARMIATHFIDTNFFQADLTDAEFGICYLGEANLSQAKLNGTNLIDANLIGADLGGSQFWQAKLFRAHGNLEKSKSHPESPIEIKSVADLIERCFTIKERYKGLTLYFRGESDCAWDLRPSVMRPSDDGTFKLRANEGEMLRELIAMRPADFTGMTSALEQMVIAQHHGLKTRLLDVSHNPCVALFSACGSRDSTGKSHNSEVNGRLHIFAVPQELIKPFDSDFVSIVCNFAKLDRGYQNLLLGKKGKDSQRENPDIPIRHLYSEAMQKLHHYIQKEKPHFRKEIDPRDFLRVFVVEPKQSFQRIAAQRGAFIISAFHERFEKEEIQRCIKDVPVYEHEVLIVPGGEKASILEELSLLDFTRETLYPSLDEVAMRIASNYL